LALELSGNIAHGEISTALRLLSRGRSTGVLVASASYASALVGFREGEVLWASSALGPKLGDVLVERGLLRRDKLDAALWVQKQDREWRALGRVLVDVKVLPEDVVALAAGEQITRILSDILRWDHGTFRFDPREPGSGEPVPPDCGDLGQLEVRVAMLRRDGPGVPA